MKNQKRYFGIFLLSLLMFSFIVVGIGVVSAGDVTVNNFFIGKPVDQGTWYSGIFNFLELGETWQQVILGIIIILIIFAGIYDILELVSIFELSWVKYLIAGGLGIAAGIIGLTRIISILLLSLVAGIGAIGIFIEIGVSIVIFILLSFGSGTAARFAARRRAAKAIAKGTLFAGKLRGLKRVADAATE